jgi:hypothetical protein
MTQTSVATPTQNYSENDDLVFEIGDEDIETPKKKHDDDHVGYGIEAEPEDEAEPEEHDPLEDFEDFEWSDEGEDVE